MSTIKNQYHKFWFFQKYEKWSSFLNFGWIWLVNELQNYLEEEYIRVHWYYQYIILHWNEQFPSRSTFNTNFGWRHTFHVRISDFVQILFFFYYSASWSWGSRQIVGSSTTCVCGVFLTILSNLLYKYCKLI